MLRKKTAKRRRKIVRRKGDSLFLTVITQSVICLCMAVMFFISAFIFENDELKTTLSEMLASDDFVFSAAKIIKKGESVIDEKLLEKSLGNAFFTKSANMPVSGEITSCFGIRTNPVLKIRELHTGVDIAAPMGTSVYAAFPAVCENVGVSKAYGNYVVLNHGNFKTKYCHLKSTPILGNMRIREGELVGYVGSSGISTGPHLHFEIEKDEKYINPESAFI